MRAWFSIHAFLMKKLQGQCRFDFLVMISNSGSCFKYQASHLYYFSEADPDKNLEGFSTKILVEFFCSLEDNSRLAEAGFPGIHKRYKFKDWEAQSRRDTRPHTKPKAS